MNLIIAPDRYVRWPLIAELIYTTSYNLMNDNILSVDLRD